MNINEWLIQFKTNWENKNIDDVLSLFSTEVLYFETPFRKLKDFTELRKEWEAILNQNQIKLDYIIYLQNNDKYTIQWDLSFTDKEQSTKRCKGVYLIKLNEKNLCEEFIQYGEENSHQ